MSEITDDSSNDNTKTELSIEIHDLQKRIDKMHKRLSHTYQYDDCLIQ